MKKTLFSPISSAGGPYGLRPQHLKDLIGPLNGSGSDSLLASLSAFVNHALEGKTPIPVCPLFFGTSLVALKTKGGSFNLSLLVVPFIVLVPNVLEVR